MFRMYNRRSLIYLLWGGVICLTFLCGCRDRLKETTKDAVNVEQTIGKDGIDCGETYLEKGRAFLQQGDVDSAIVMARTGLACLAPETSQWLNARAFIGNIYYFHKSNPYRAYPHFETVLTHLLVQRDSVSSQRLALAYYFMGLAASGVGEMEKAKRLLTHNLDLCLKTEGISTIQLATAYAGLGEVFFEIDDCKRAREVFSEALDLVSKDNTQPIETILSYQSNLALAYGCEGKHEEAFRLLAKRQQLLGSADDTDNYHAVYGFLNLGVTARNWGKIKVATGYFDKALKLAEPGPEKAEILSEYAAMILDQKKYDQALQMIHQAVCEAAPRTRTSDMFALPVMDEVPDEWELQKALETKANILLKYYEDGNANITYLSVALSHYQALIRLMDQIRLNYANEEDQLFLNQLAYGSRKKYAEAIRCAYYLYQETGEQVYVDAIFSFMEKNKAQVLLEALKLSQTTYSLGIPDDRLNEGEAIRNQIEQIQNQLHAIKQGEETIKTDTSSLIEEKEKWGFKLKEWEQQLRDDFPGLNDTSQNYTSATLSEVKEKLIQDSLRVISFFVEDSTQLWRLVIDADTTRIDRLFLSDDFDRDMTQFLRIIARPDNRLKTWERYTHTGHAIYKQLLALPDSEQKKKVLIIPDGLLSQLPFEVLLTKPAVSDTGHFKTLPYLIKTHTVSYAQSATLLLAQIGEPVTRRPLEVLGMAFSGEIDLLRHDTIDPYRTRGSLPGSEREVALMGRMLAGNYVAGKDASETYFKHNAEKFGVLHLAIHGATDRGLPRLIFPFDNNVAEHGVTREDDGILYLHELYNLSLWAEMAVLSACETGIGKVAEGEGVLNLARGFTYAGCSSVIMSLWNVKDLESALIMHNFYRELQGGHSKDVALQKAKVLFLQETDEMGAHPAYWGSMVPLGDMRPLPLKKKGWF